jgi:hypothetical protein
VEVSVSKLLAGSVVSLVLLSATMTVPLASAAPGAVERHCVVEVVDQHADGELILSAPRCFGSFAEAVADASNGTVLMDAEASGAVLFSDPTIDEALLASFTLGIHFDGLNGSGSSISVVGSACTGGWWNTGFTWANRISSSWNGCYRLRHHDYPNKQGASESTIGAGATHNLSALSNSAESVSYWSS